ncbi:unnamed protein product [Umbelopsis vinacea]
MTSKPSDTLKQDLTAALEAAGKSLLETAELFKRVSSLEITPAVEEPKVNSRKKKDPNAPKRPPGSFFLFANDRRPKLRDEQPETSTKDIARLLGEEWKVLGEKAKKAYIQKADVQKERYNKEIEAYKSKKPAEADVEEEEVDELEEKEEEKPKEEAAPKPKKKAKAQPKPKAAVAAPEPAPAENEAEPKKKRGRQAAPKETKEAKTESKETSSKKAKTKKSA